MYADKDEILRDVPVPFGRFDNNDYENLAVGPYCPNNGDYRKSASEEKKIIYLK